MPLHFFSAAFKYDAEKEITGGENYSSAGSQCSSLRCSNSTCTLCGTGSVSKSVLFSGLRSLLWDVGM